jgi:hypothetical protein
MSAERFDIIKLGLRDNDIKKNDSGGGDPKYFAEGCGKELRDFISARINNLKQAFSNDFARYPEVPAVGKVRLKKDALAKSHRPIKIFNDKTCPIIGVDRFGELLIKVTPDRLDNLAKIVQETKSPQAEANITAIEDIAPNNINDVLAGIDLKTLKEKYRKNPGEPIKVQLFDYKDVNANNKNKEIFNKLVAQLGAEVLGIIKYSDTLISYKVKVPKESALEILASYIGVRKLTFFPRYKVEPSRKNPLMQSIDVSTLKMPDNNEDYPVVGLVDSGIAEGHPYLEPWIYARKIYVPDNERNYSHGTFVGGILVHGNEFLGNGSDTGVKIVDVTAIPNWDKAHGDVGELREDELIIILEEVVSEFRDIVSVWNLSLGTDEECKEESFSDLAIKLDDLQRQNNVIFVIAAGNINTLPLRGWPPGTYSCDKITSPADSVCGITVGSVAHLDCDNSLVKKGHPSPFSRKGPGPSFLVKPDIVHYGGNCRADGNSDGIGMVSFDEHGNLVESVGTSFSTPLVSQLTSKIYDAIENPSNNLVKALIIHSARHPQLKITKSKQKELSIYDYYGFGIPGTMQDILSCPQNQFTLIIEGKLSIGNFISIDDFPFPDSLVKEGKCYGEINITLVYDPPLNATFGVEYCRNNMNVSFGTWYIDKKGALKYKRRVPPEPDLSGRFERELIANGFKWSPVKVYRKNLQGIKYGPWRLVIDLTPRREEVKYEPQNFALVMSIIDPEGSDINSEMIAALQKKHIFEKLAIKTRSRVQIGL